MIRLIDLRGLPTSVAIARLSLIKVSTCLYCKQSTSEPKLAARQVTTSSRWDTAAYYLSDGTPFPATLQNTGLARYSPQLRAAIVIRYPPRTYGNASQLSGMYSTLGRIRVGYQA